MNEQIVGHFAPSGQQGEKAKALVYILIVIFVLVIVSIVIKKVFGGIDGLLEALHLKDDAATVANKNKIADYNDTANEPGSPWTAAFYKSAPSDSPVQQAISNNDKAFFQKFYDDATTIYDSVGYLWDDPSSGLGALKSLNTKAELSVVADFFYQKYSTDLWEFLHKHYDTHDQVQALADAITYINGLPNY